jgi:hypothetical protein
MAWVKTPKQNHQLFRDSLPRKAFDHTATLPAKKATKPARKPAK